jgi:hypothetical protein
MNHLIVNWYTICQFYKLRVLWKGMYEFSVILWLKWNFEYGVKFYAAIHNEKISLL